MGLDARSKKALGPSTVVNPPVKAHGPFPEYVRTTKPPSATRLSRRTECLKPQVTPEIRDSLPRSPLTPTLAAPKTHGNPHPRPTPEIPTSFHGSQTEDTSTHTLGPRPGAVRHRPSSVDDVQPPSRGHLSVPGVSIRKPKISLTPMISRNSSEPFRKVFWVSETKGGRKRKDPVCSREPHRASQNPVPRPSTPPQVPDGSVLRRVPCKGTQKDLPKHKSRSPSGPQGGPFEGRTHAESGRAGQRLISSRVNQD